MDETTAQPEVVETPATEEVTETAAPEAVAEETTATDTPVAAEVIDA